MLECCCRKLKKFPKIPTDGWLSQHQLGFLSGHSPVSTIEIHKLQDAVAIASLSNLINLAGKSSWPAAFPHGSFLIVSLTSSTGRPIGATLTFKGLEIWSFMLGNSELTHHILMYTLNSTLLELSKYGEKATWYSSLMSGVLLLGSIFILVYSNCWIEFGFTTYKY